MSSPLKNQIYKEETEVKTKEELIEKWENYKNGARTVADMRAVEYADKFINDLNQLDEPETLSQTWISKFTSPVDDEGRLYVWKSDLQNLLVPNQELPVIPKFVADWISVQRDIGYTLQQTFYQVHWAYKDNDRDKEQEWVVNNEELFARAWLDGFTVEKEQNYQVLFPTDERLVAFYDEGNKHTMITRTTLSDIGGGAYNVFTEQEIKDYDKRYWPFAVKVEELNR